MKTRLAAAFAVAALVIAPAAVRAHAFLDHSNPAVGSTVPAAPSQIHLWFTQELEPAFSWVTVSDKSGASVNDGPAAIDPNNKSELTIKLKPLATGTYTVKWHALSVDTHTTQGDFKFQVKKG
ncbi:MAG: copper resistance protein CopC [Candidatus Eremiobacteraeota bacterium]|nr:copper resistance protein CopC [Candidatus Eremiobacteraeota bacterium]